MTDHLSQVPRVSLNFLPTPLVELNRLSQFLGGPAIFIKRDDLTGLGLGGNKTRKLEFLLGEAIDQGCDAVITGGAMQSNHSRQTAAASRAVGLECHLALGGQAPPCPTGNLLLDYLFGANIHWCGAEEKGERIPDIAENLRREGKKPYIIPFGGSNEVGSLGFVAAMGELKTQLTDQSLSIDHIVLPSSSGGTQSGMVVGADAFDLPVKIMGIGIDRSDPGNPSYESEMAGLANRTAEKLGLPPRYQSSDFHMRYDYFGLGYGMVGDLEREAIRLAGACEGILLDPVYTGRTMGGLIDMIRNKVFSTHDRILFWHTGGLPAVFDYGDRLLSRS